MAIRYYQPKDEKQIQRLAQKVFGTDHSLERWKWKYLKNPKQTEPFILIFEENEKILGHIALWISDVFVNGKLERIGLRVDTMVDPDARGKGIYSKLNQEMLKEAEKKNISYLYGFPAPKAKEILLKHTKNSMHVSDISRYMLILNPVKLVSSLLKIATIFKPIETPIRKFQMRKWKRDPLPAGWEVKIMKRCDERFDRLAEEMKQFKPIILKRDAAYLNWRYLDHPENDYSILVLMQHGKLKGYSVYKKETNIQKKGEVSIGYIVDVLAIEDEEVWDHLIKETLHHLEEVDVIQSWVFPENMLANTLRRQGFREKDRPMPLVVHEIRETKDFNVANPFNWWITQGDVDSF